MKRQRPPMPPLAVRVKVAERQVTTKFGQAVTRAISIATETWGDQLHCLLKQLGFEKPELHHNPALILRLYDPEIQKIASRYTPNANNPDFLEYLDAPDHQQRTTGRKPGALRTVTTKGSDIGIKTKFARLERKKNLDRLMKMSDSKFNKMISSLQIIKVKRPKAKIASRPFPKGRKFDARR